MTDQKYCTCLGSILHACTSVCQSTLDSCCTFLKPTSFSDSPLSKSPAEARNSSAPSSSSICTNSLQQQGAKRKIGNLIRPPLSSACLTSANFNLENINCVGCIEGFRDINSMIVIAYTAGLTTASRSILMGSKSKP